MNSFILTTIKKITPLIILISCPLIAYANAGMEKMETQEFDEFYIASKLSMPTSRKAFIEETRVSFSDIWMTEFASQTSRNYRRVIKKKYGAAVTEDLKVALMNQGWEVSEKKTDQTIVIQAHLHDLHISAPDQNPGKQSILLKNVGSAAIKVSFFSPKGSPIMEILDAEDTPDIVGSPLANRSYNLTYFKMLFDNWGNLSAAYLESVVEEVEKQLGKQQAN